MTRALRILAMSGLLIIIVYEAYIAVQIGTSADTYVLPLQSQSVVLLLDLVWNTGFYLAFAAGIIGTVAALQRQEHEWAAVFIILLIVCSYDPYLVNFLLSLLYLPLVLDHVGRLGEILYQLLTQLAAPMALAVLVLIFTFTRRTEIATP